MHLSAEDNAIMKGMLWGIPKSVILEQLDTIFKFAELEQDRHKRLATYSNGMMARLGFAIALHADSETYLFDEVFSVGDAVFRQKSSGLLLQKIEDGRSALFVSHHLELIKKFCHKVLWLEKGKQKMLGETQEVCAAYQAWVELQKKSSPH
jgi:ABC-type polysaccharide/polyol phosphate transport system ATPase subunit